MQKTLTEPSNQAGVTLTSHATARPSTQSTEADSNSTLIEFPGARNIPEWRKRNAITVIKLGDQGAVWLTPDRDILVPAPKVKAIDTTGAGDSFNAGFLVAWMNGKPPEQCLAAGNKIGAASTRTAGGI